MILSFAFLWHVWAYDIFLWIFFNFHISASFSHSYFNWLSINNCSENFSIFDCFLTWTMNIKSLIFIRACLWNLNREQESFFKSLNQFLFVFQFRDVLNVECLRATSLVSDNNMLAILLQLNFFNCVTHILIDCIHPVNT